MVRTSPVVIMDGSGSGVIVTVVTVVVRRSPVVIVVGSGSGLTVTVVIVVAVRRICVVVVFEFRWRVVIGVPVSVEHSSSLKREVQSSGRMLRQRTSPSSQTHPNVSGFGGRLSSAC